METVEITRSDLRFVLRAIDTALPELEAAVHDGLIDESVLIELSEAQDICLQSLNVRK